MYSNDTRAPSRWRRRYGGLSDKLSRSVRVTDLPQSLGGLPPVSPEYLRAYVDEFNAFAREVLPQIQQRARSASGAWAAAK